MKTYEDHTSTTWIIDTACSRHLTGNRSLFPSLRETAPIKFQLADSSSHITATHVGDIPIKYREHTITLHDIYYSADVGFNLLSGTQAMQETGASLLLSKDKKVLTTGDGIEIRSANWQGALYATNTIEVSTTSSAQGPMVAPTEIISQTGGAPFPQLLNVPFGTPGNSIIQYRAVTPVNFRE